MLRHASPLHRDRGGQAQCLRFVAEIGGHALLDRQLACFSLQPNWFFIISSFRADATEAMVLSFFLSPWSVIVGNLQM
jgi:hypothetical protein